MSNSNFRRPSACARKFSTPRSTAARSTPTISANENDQHATVSASISGDKTTIHLRVSGDFGIAYPFAAPADGAPSSNLKIVSESWNEAHDRLQLQVAGAGGAKYEVPVFNAPSDIGVSGATVYQTEVRIGFGDFVPSGTAGCLHYPHRHCSSSRAMKKETVRLAHHSSSGLGGSVRALQGGILELVSRRATDHLRPDAMGKSVTLHSPKRRRTTMPPDSRLGRNWDLSAQTLLFLGTMENSYYIVCKYFHFS